MLEAGASPGASDLAALDVGAAPTFAAAAPPGVYYVRVRGSNNCGTGSASNEVIVTLGAPTIAPDAPSHVVFTLAGHIVTLTWIAPAGGPEVASYVVEAGTASALSNIVSVPNVGTILTAIAPTGTYYVRVRAANAAGVGPPSPEVIIRVP
jgi:hypothetical protein